VSKHPATRDLILASAKIFSAAKPTQQTFEIRNRNIFLSSLLLENIDNSSDKSLNHPPQRLDQDGKLLTTFL
jgi:hypothetical protein